MERLTKHSKQTSHENGICCTHFRGPECLEVGGNCAMNCKWEEAAWSRLAAYEDTGLTPERCAEFARADAEGRYIWSYDICAVGGGGGGCYDQVMRDAKQERVARLRELTEADKDGRLVVLPFTSGRTLLCKENIDSPRLMKDVELAIRYCSSCGIVFHMDYNVFCDLVKHGRITAVSE